jgi:hypothetical protein
MPKPGPGGAFEGSDGSEGKLPYWRLRSKGLPEASSGGEGETAEDGIDSGPDLAPD